MREFQKDIKGKAYWRSLDQLADTPEFRQYLEREFPENASEMTDPVSRRKFLGLMGASLAFAGLASCRRPIEKIVPYVKAPEHVIPGIPQYFATTATLGATAYGLLVESHEGRPTKIEGNDKHPSAHGKTNALLQSEILNMYDPDRAKEVLHDGNESSWQDFVNFWKDKHQEFVANKGEGLAVVSGEFASPSLSRLYKSFKSTFPKALWVVDELISNENIYNGLKKATGTDVRADYHYESAKVVLSIDHDFLGSVADSVSASYRFAQARRVKDDSKDMNRLYVAESAFSITGGMADHRVQLSQKSLEAFVQQLAGALGVIASSAKVVDSNYIAAIAKDLKANAGKSIVVAGYRQSAETHALVYAINAALSNNGNSISYHQDLYAVLAGNSMAELRSAAEKGHINTLISFDNNLVYNAPGDFNATALLKKIETKIALSSHKDETSAQANWLIPSSHFLEAWGDAAAINGVLSVTQPLIQPLYNSKSTLEVMNLAVTGESKKGYDLVRDTWTGILGSLNKKWDKVLHDGVYSRNTKISTALSNSPTVSKIEIAKLSEKNLEIVFYPSASVYDGRYANNGWMQEAPDPVTKIAWDNAALINPNTAKALGVSSKELVTLSVNGQSMEIVVSVMPGVADNVVALELGYGRSSIGRIADGVGFNVNKLRSVSALNSASEATISQTGKTYKLANTQDHNSMEGRPLIRENTMEAYKEGDDFAPALINHPPLKSLFDDHDYSEGYQWGMAIDLNTCTGCNTCLVACQSENNIPVIGKEQVEKGREMHWMRMDRYFAGDVDNPEMVYQPMACQHCENAPCEQVCPVQATLHDEEGLNVMTYNRCVGTRYCSNNCPFKVRRFNFFNYTKDLPETVKMQFNPDVTVRFRGVMEKCTYCTQRLQQAKIGAKNEGRTLQDGDVVSACQQACPTDSIIFGNINDPQSAVSKLKKSNRNYDLLGELNIRPRTSYLGKLRNPNPEIVKLTETVS